MKKAGKIQMRHSVKIKLFAVICAIAIAFIGILSMLNLFFYKDYYLFERRNTLTHIYNSVNTRYNGQVLDISDELEQTENQAAVRLSIVDVSGQLLYDSFYREHRNVIDVPDDTGMKASYYDGMMIRTALASANVENIEKQGYAISTVQIVRNGVKASTEEFLCLVGMINEKQQILIARIPMAYMEQNTSFNMMFLMIAGGISLILCSGLAYLVSRQFIRPIIEIEEVATTMAELDFTKKYTGKAKDEIGRLGDSINQLSEHLETAIGDLKRTNEELAYEVDEKERIDSMRKEFIVNVSHELKTPIALIQGYAEGLRVGVIDNEADREYYCDIIVDEAHRMNHLVMQLLDLSKLELGKEQPEPVEVDLQLLCQAVVQKLDVLCEEKHHSIDYNYCNAIMYVDYQMIEQVITNYLSNAIRYTPEGGNIKVSSAENQDGSVSLYVDNEGEGIAENELNMIFEKFYRTDKARSRESGGTGIGLSIVKAIADAHGGSCGAKNIENGVRFWFIVPPQT